MISIQKELSFLYKVGSTGSSFKLIKLPTLEANWQRCQTGKTPHQFFALN